MPGDEDRDNAVARPGQIRPLTRSEFSAREIQNVFDLGKRGHVFLVQQIAAQALHGTRKSRAGTRHRNDSLAGAGLPISAIEKTHQRRADFATSSQYGNVSLQFLDEITVGVVWPRQLFL